MKVDVYLLLCKVYDRTLDRSWYGRILHGELLVAADINLSFISAVDKVQARVLSRDNLYNIIGQTRLIKEVVNVKMCVRLNYVKYVGEAGRKPPLLFFIFFKPNITIYDYDVLVVTPKIIQDNQADYKGKLVCILLYYIYNNQQRHKIRPVFKALSYVAGFNTYVLLGACLVAVFEIPNPKKLHLYIIVVGEGRQDENIKDLLFNYTYSVLYLWQGTTLRKGGVIMMGTPGDVGACLKPPKYLVPGTQMDVWISRIGTLRYSVVFATNALG
ncbi:hypothetical protein BJX65DRAFT_300174 [Aspergillus insuetus]